MTEDVSRAFVKSQNVNPLDFLSDGKTPDAAKTRLTSIVSIVIQNGLSMRDGVLHFGVGSSDMADAKTALKLLKEGDTNFMRHANDSLVNAMGSFIHAYQNSQMGPAKLWEQNEPERYLPQIKITLDNLYKRGFDGAVEPQKASLLKDVASSQGHPVLG